MSIKVDADGQVDAAADEAEAMDVKDATFDVAIVGMGPTGCVAAALLGQAGLKVMIMDQAIGIYDKPRAISMDHEIMRTFQQLGIADEVIQHTEPFTASEHFGADGQMIRRLDMLPPPYPMGWTPSMVFLQPPVERILRDKVASFPRVMIRLGCELTALTQDAQGAVLASRDATGQLSVMRAKYVIGCDGASSTVRRLCDLALEDLDFDEPWLVVDVQAHASGLAKLPKCSAQFCEPARPMSYLIGTGNHRRWEIMLLPGEHPKDMLTDDRIWQLLSRWLTPQDGVIWRKATYRFHALVAKDWRRGRVFLAGDAAHQQPPFLGQGMCQGIRDASNLAWKLAHVLSHAGSVASQTQFLDSYGFERGAHVRSLITAIKKIGQYICERDIDLARTRDAKLLADQGGTVQSVPRQDLMPSLPSDPARGLFSNQKHAAHGTLFVQPLVVHGHGVSLMDDVHGCGWRLVTCDASLAQVVRHALMQTNQPVHVVLVQEQDGIGAAWFARHQCQAALLRPDHYVYAVAHTSSQALDEIASLAQKWVV